MNQQACGCQVVSGGGDGITTNNSAPISAGETQPESHCTPCAMLGIMAAGMIGVPLGIAFIMSGVRNLRKWWLLRKERPAYEHALRIEAYEKSITDATRSLYRSAP